MEQTGALFSSVLFNPLKAELNPVCHLLALLGGATIVVVSRLRVKDDVNYKYFIPSVIDLINERVWLVE